MLVLKRQLHQSITIGDDIKITVVEIQEGAVRLGIAAPREIPVHREEVRDAIRDANVVPIPPGSVCCGCQGLTEAEDAIVVGGQIYCPECSS